MSPDEIAFWANAMQVAIVVAGCFAASVIGGVVVVLLLLRKEEKGR